jgi:2,4-dienoyl-CoA reductase-like NADH-dependent reductase (Old Yellow Enzyme family)
MNFVKPRQMTEKEIVETIEDFGEGARRVKEAGFDGVQIHAAHGYLINQFLSAHTNRRKDAWGGSRENRMRFLVEIFQAMRARVGPEYPILTKINAEDFAKTGVHPEECVEHCKKLDALGIAAIEVSGGIYETGLHTIKGDLPMDLFLEGRGLVERFMVRMMQGSLERSTAFEEGYFLSQAETIKKSVSVPVLAVGGLRKRKMMEQVLESGQADFISLCRPFIRQPNLVKLMERGDEDPISCTSCNRCSMEILFHKKPMRCYKN